MEIQITILDNKRNKDGFSKPVYNLKFSGNYAIESAITTLTEIFFGNNLKIKVQNLLDSKLSTNEMIHNLELTNTEKK